MNKLKSLAISILCIGLASCSSTTGQEKYKSYGEKIEDTKIVHNIKDAYARNKLISSDIHIAVDRGIVQLSGFVPTHEEADLAIINTRNIEGVKWVIDNIIVLSSKEYLDKRAKAESHRIPK